MLLAIVTSCSNKLDKETLPSTTATTESTVESTSETSETQPSHGPNSTAQVTEMPVPVHGQLSVNGTDIVDQNGEVYQLKGMSSYGINACANFFNADIVKTLAEDWGCSVLRLAMTTRGNSDDYTRDPEKYFNEMCDYINMCIDQGIYVIIDWHILYDGDPNEFKTESIDFFSRMSALYGENPNVIYEICNEPNGTRFDDESAPVDWSNCVKPYAQEVVAAIRANDPDNIIIIGTPTWSQDVDIASADPVTGTNLMYTCHFYAGSHGQELRDKIVTANNNGCAVFVTEWGTTNDSGKGQLYVDETNEWIDFLNERNISWCNWSIGGSNTEASNALKFQSQILTIEEKYAGHWPDEFLTSSGTLVRSLILEQE
ncbi:MAG: glycoside hydrolase family 5 protein [Clostridiales bacterium]|nr:glycoside hydrolase family 5 protein [Clostridiales bacterium]